MVLARLCTHALIKRCAELAGGLSPPFADWSAPTFVAAWSQRMVIAIQSTNACVALRNFTRSITATQAGACRWIRGSAPGPLGSLCLYAWGLVRGGGWVFRVLFGLRLELRSRYLW